jgi:uncharacterized protein
MWARAALTALTLLAFAPAVLAAHIPAPTGYVNDYANLLTAEQAKTLDDQLKQVDEKTGNEIAVAIVNTVGDDTIEEFAVRTFEEWKIGKEDKDNGVLLLVAKDDRRLRIEVGYGLEGTITDAKAGSIIRNQISPRFAEGNYNAGITAGLAQLQSEISRDEANISPLPQPAPKGQDEGLPFWLLFLAWPLMTYIGAFLGRTKSWWLGGILGAAAGAGLGTFINASLIAAGVLGAFGLLLDYLLSRNYRERRRHDQDTSFWGSGGGFFGGGGGGGGGFGGFGGGGSGGGGASGRW